MDIQSVTVEPWLSLELPREEVKATLQYLAHKARKPVSFRWYTEGEGYSPQSVSVRNGKEIRFVELLDVTRSGDEKLSFLNLHFVAHDTPIVATKGSDLYLWMPCVEENGNRVWSAP